MLDVAEELSAWLRGLDIKVLYIASDASNLEIQILEKLLKGELSLYLTCVTGSAALSVIALPVLQFTVLSVTALHCASLQFTVMYCIVYTVHYCCKQYCIE